MSTEPQVCGSCRFAVSIPNNKQAKECFGMPPTIFVLGAKPNMLGMPELNVQTMSPRVGVDRKACSLYQPLLDN